MKKTAQKTAKKTAMQIVFILLSVTSIAAQASTAPVSENLVPAVMKLINMSQYEKNCGPKGCLASVTIRDAKLYGLRTGTLKFEAFLEVNRNFTVVTEKDPQKAQTLFDEALSLIRLWDTSASANLSGDADSLTVGNAVEKISCFTSAETGETKCTVYGI